MILIRILIIILITSELSSFQKKLDRQTQKPRLIFKQFLFSNTLYFSINRGLVVRLAAVLSWGIVCGDSTAIRVGVKKEKRLEVIFNTFADHIFPPGADLQKDKEKAGQSTLYKQI